MAMRRCMFLLLSPDEGSGHMLYVPFGNYSAAISMPRREMIDRDPRSVRG